ncbi:signal peptidase II [Lentilactobacillus kribbianus]|uniref:signal peptidase II n=1 Tax=Lentilactobacillus kribbianus TaxID=2729622 RepID=UPI001555F268|nr:signal peptidase II [Lentilactobacillus kribbianus]
MILYFVLILVLIGIDQGIKMMTVANLSLGQVVNIIPNWFSLTRLNNSGAAWSILEGQKWFFVLVGLIATGLIITFMFHYKEKKMYLISLSLILAGTIGNLIDRIHNGYVVDMFQLDFVNFPIFNGADIFLTIGIIILTVLIIKEK